jgi:hypothetical protein
VIALIRDLPAPQQRQLIKLLDPRADLDDLDDQGVVDELVRTLRRSLEVPAKDDLPEYLRRRLVDVVRRHFELADDVDTRTDLELAQMLVDFALDAAHQLASDRERREEFETFLRTKSRRERLDWLVASERASALVTNTPFDRSTARTRAESLSDESGAHRETARVILADLSTLTSRSPGRRSDPGRGRLAAGAAAGAGVAALGPAVALPLGALAGGLFMAGRGKRALVKVAEEEAEKTRAQRARRSRLVQTVVTLSAFVVANTGDDRQQ